MADAMQSEVSKDGSEIEPQHASGEAAGQVLPTNTALACSPEEKEEWAAANGSNLDISAGPSKRQRVEEAPDIRLTAPSFTSRPTLSAEMIDQLAIKDGPGVIISLADYLNIPLELNTAFCMALGVMQGPEATSIYQCSGIEPDDLKELLSHLRIAVGSGEDWSERLPTPIEKQKLRDLVRLCQAVFPPELTHEPGASASGPAADTMIDHPHYQARGVGLPPDMELEARLEDTHGHPKRSTDAGLLALGDRRRKPLPQPGQLTALDTFGRKGSLPSPAPSRRRSKGRTPRRSATAKRARRGDKEKKKKHKKDKEPKRHKKDKRDKDEDSASTGSSSDSDGSMPQCDEMRFKHNRFLDQDLTTTFTLISEREANRAHARWKYLHHGLEPKPKTQRATDEQISAVLSFFRSFKRHVLYGDAAIMRPDNKAFQRLLDQLGPPGAKLQDGRRRGRFEGPDDYTAWEKFWAIWCYITEGCDIISPAVNEEYRLLIHDLDARWNSDGKSWYIVYGADVKMRKDQFAEYYIKLKSGRCQGPFGTMPSGSGRCARR